MNNGEKLESNNNLSISVIIPMRNESLFAKNKIMEVLDEIYNLEHIKLIIIDSNSTDKTSEIAKSTLIESKFPKFRWKVLKIDVSGKTRALNFAISISRSDLIMIMDADAEASQGWEIICQEGFKQERIGLISGVQITEDATNMSNMEKKYKYYSNNRRLRQSNKTSIVIPEGSICCFRRSAIRDYGLDERFNADDTQISLICLRNGYKCIIDKRLKFRENQNLPWNINFNRRIRRGRGLSNVLLRNLDMIRPSINPINYKDVINTLALYLFVPWLVMTTVTILVLCFSVSEISHIIFLNIAAGDIYSIISYLFLILFFSIINIRFPVIISLLEGSIIMIIAQISIITHKDNDAWDPIRELRYIDLGEFKNEIES